MSHVYAARYTVRASDEADGLVGLARRFYGDEARWAELYEANISVIGDDPNLLKSGQHLVIPGMTAGVHRGTMLYVVQPADEEGGLQGLARRFYGDPQRWQEIRDANTGVIGDDPSAIEAGQCLLITNLADTK